MQIAALLAEARQALSVGDRAKAKQFASQALRLDSKHIETWLLLADLVEVPAQKRDCFQRILAIDPTNAQAKQALNQLDAPAPVAAASFELPKSAWFGSKSAEPELTAQVGGPIATAPLATNAPSGIRPLGSSQAASLVELSNTAVGGTTPTGYVQPIQPSYNQTNYPQPNQAYSLPAASYGQAQPQYGQVTYPYVEPSGAAKFLKWLVFATLGLIVVCAGIGLMVNFGKEPPPTPKVSAQDRTTAMLGDTMKIIVNPDFYDKSKQKAIVEPYLNNYFIEAARTNTGRLDQTVLDSFDNGVDQQAFLAALPYIKDAYVTPTQYTVESQTNEMITLKLISGDLVFTFHNGKFLQVPLKDTYDTFTWVNDDGRWYLAGISLK
ncbi:MAG TPA: hypothetical protein DEF47_15145 [Herpetosiphon sp.]|uniref:Tetratricopeptide TPR_2 repeat protein n=1 Tax=Herpetosiphon aurantiacus (strain ATCC 23779 / DSM 785 / 114-95) TaxID=316274 RepID=A9B0F3_HERA2|nr:hypothetical protein [Herpetosiphon sp.]ABX05262.1 hypothetical protein Haur_2624 [Herpetosiphon aurantiacus DSM 785]HBW51228.1 hypothetical protein [Herpetosiphon sp.]